MSDCLLVLGLELVGEGELGGLLLQLGKLVLVLGDLLERGLDELALHVGDAHVKLVDLEVAQDHLALKEEHLALKVVPSVEKDSVIFGHYNIYNRDRGFLEGHYIRNGLTSLNADELSARTP